GLLNIPGERPERIDLHRGIEPRERIVIRGRQTLSKRVWRRREAQHGRLLSRSVSHRKTQPQQNQENRVAHDRSPHVSTHGDYSLYSPGFAIWATVAFSRVAEQGA